MESQHRLYLMKSGANKIMARKTRQKVTVKQRGPITVRKTVTVTKTVKPRR